MVLTVNRLVSRYYTLYARGQPRARRRSWVSWRIMAERRRHKKRIQVTSLNWSKLLPVRVDGEQIKLVCWFTTCCRMFVNGSVLVRRRLQAPDEARWWLTGASISWLAKTNVSIYILIRPFRANYAVQQYHSHTCLHIKTALQLLAYELPLQTAVFIVIEPAVNVCWLSCVSSRRVYITWGNLREF